MSFEISFTDALILMPKFASTLKYLIGNKEKLSEMARTPMNVHCSAVILNKLPKKLGDPGKFLIPCEFPGMDECLALADLGVSINLMPIFVWEELSLPEITSTCMTLELANRTLSKPIGIAKDVKVKTGRALIDVHKGELTLRIENEAITYNLDQTSRYSANYDQMTANDMKQIRLKRDKSEQNRTKTGSDINQISHSLYHSLKVSILVPLDLSKDIKTLHQAKELNIYSLESTSGIRARDNALVVYTKNLEKAEKERDELKLTLEKYPNSSESLNTLLESQGITYYLKPDLMFIDKQVKSESVDVVFNVTSSAVKSVESKVESVDVKNKGVYNTIETKPIKKNNFSPPIIEDWNSDDESELEFKPKVESSIFEESDFDVQAMKDADYEPAARLRPEKQRKKTTTKAQKRNKI
uniref:Reverse transcriptase domain-containing protein n=1 Tax=Tanacetum cinerariifolium TaxID=118510 RepID=A0A6L2K4I0_TANCI|nr:reverse transcriptase domain-containing protein [Tanacetum cinerariifolium]